MDIEIPYNYQLAFARELLAKISGNFVVTYKQYLLPTYKNLGIFNRGVIYRRKPGINFLKTVYSGMNFQFFCTIRYKP